MRIGDKRTLYRRYFVRHPERYDKDELSPAENTALLNLDGLYHRLQSRHFIWLHGSQHAYRILQKLFDLEYVDRLNACRYWDGGIVYGLTQKGARHLAHLKGKRAPRADFDRRNRTFPPHKLKHDQMIAAVRVAAVVAAQSHPHMRVIFGNELLNHMPEGARNQRDPFRLYASLETQKGVVEVSTKDDEPMLIKDAREGAEFADQMFLTECDAFTESITSEAQTIKRSFNPSIIEHKYAFLRAYAREKRHLAQFGVKPLRILFPVADSPETGVQGALERIEHMIQANKEVYGGIGSNRFLFTTEHNLTPDRIFDAEVWITGQGKLTRLFDHAT